MSVDLPGWPGDDRPSVVISRSFSTRRSRLIAASRLKAWDFDGWSVV